ncbi:MAG: putative Zn-dependent peptidase [Bradymonadia bacterium]|jgi:predicted Zn-dependent peptidase
MNIDTSRLTQARATLPNGARIIAISQPHLGTAALNVDVRVGSRHEATADNGLSHLLEHMIFQGCASEPDPKAVNRRAEGMGAAFEAWTARDATRLSHWLDPAQLADSAGLLADLMHRPKFANLETERAIVLEEGLDELDERGNLVDADTWSRRDAWPDSPLGQSVIGLPRNLERFTVDDLKRFHARHYCARNLVITCVGPRPVDEMIAAMAPFGALPTGEMAVADGPGRGPKGPKIRTVEDGRSQIDARLLYRCPGRLDAAAPAIDLLRRALDDGLAARLHERLGGELGLAYDQWAMWEHYTDTGCFELGALVSLGKLQQFVVEAHGLLRGLIDNPPAGEELDRIKFRAGWAIRSAYDAHDGLIALYGSPHLYEESPPTPEEWLARINAVTPAQLAEVARAIFVPENYVSCFVGPLTKTDRRSLKAFTHKVARG